MKDKIRAAFSEIHADAALISRTSAYLHAEMDRRQRKKPFRFPIKEACVAMTALVVGLFASGLYFTADAHVGIDVNPSIELTLNRFDRIIGTQSFNEEGAQILEVTETRGKTFDKAVESIISAVKDDGYLTGGALVSLTVQASNNDREQKLYDTLSSYSDILSANEAAKVEVIPITTEVWGNAHSCGVSPARYLAIQELMEVDEEATIEAYRGSGILQIRQRTQECRGNMHNINPSGSDSAPIQQGMHHGQSHGFRNRGGHY